MPQLPGPTCAGIAESARRPTALSLPFLCCLQGHATDAWDFLGTQTFSTAAAEAQRHALMAILRIDAWAEVRPAPVPLRLLTGSPEGLVSEVCHACCESCL